MQKPFSILSIIVMVVLAALQAAHITTGQTVNINGLQIPVVASIVGLIVAIGLALGIGREIFGRRADSDGEDVPTPSGRTRSVKRSGSRGAPVWEQNGQRLPADYFMFASRGVTAKAIRAAAEKYDRVLVGFDAGNIPEASMRAAKDVGAELSIYVEGAGGPTGNAWAADERARVRQAAASVGVNTSHSAWMKEWDDWAWKAYTFKQLEGYLAEGYTAGEIDNLGRVLDGEAVEPLMQFLGEYAEQCMSGHLPRLVLKNMAVPQMEAIADAVESGQLPRAMFSEFHISEKGTGNRKQQDAASSRIAIRTVPSNDTYNYDAFGEYGLGKRFAELQPPAPTPAPVQPSTPVPADGPAIASAQQAPGQAGTV